MNIIIGIIAIVSIPCLMILLYKVAKARGRSGHWLWWGIYPIFGLFALLILLMRPRLGVPTEGAAPKPKLGALNIVGFIVLIIGALATASTVAQIVMGMGEDHAAHLIVGIIIIAVGLVMATRKKLPNTALEPTAAAPSVSDTPSNPKAGGDSTSASSGGGSALDR